MREPAFERMLQRGPADFHEWRVMSNEEMEHCIRISQK